MNRATLLGTFALLCAAQLALPAWKMQHQFDLESNAPRFLCRARPIDPVDPLRGRYVSIDLDGLEELPLDPGPGEDTERGHGMAYLVFAEGPDGFATYSLTHQTPDHDAWLRVRYFRQGEKARVLVSSLPFTRYYLKETRAPLAEEAYRRAAGEAQAWIALRVQRGDAALEELFIDGKPILEWLREHEAGAEGRSVSRPGKLEVQPPEESEDGEAESEPGHLEEPLVGR